MPTDTPGRTKLLVRNGLYAVLSWSVPVVLAIIVTPIVVRGLGDEAYGLYAAIIGFISYSFSFGIGKAAAKYVAEYRAAGETYRISEIVSSVLWLSLGFGILAVGVIAFAARFIVTDVLLISPAFQLTAVVGLYLGGVTILVAMLSQVFQFILQGLHRFDRSLLLTNLNALLLNLGSVALVKAGFGVVELLVWNAIVVLVVGFMFYLSVRRLLPEFALRFTITLEHWTAALKYSLSIVAFQVFSNALLLFERGWIVRRFGAEALTYYVVPMALAMYMHSFVVSIVLVTFPVVNELLADRQKLTALYKTSTKLILALVVFAVVTAWAGGEIFLRLWMRSDDFAARSYSLLVMHFITFGILAATTIIWQIPESFRKPAWNVISVVLLTAISLPLMIVLSDGGSTQGVAIARIAGVLIFIPFTVLAEKAFLGVVFWQFWAGALWKTALAAALAAAVETQVFSSLSAGWPGLIIGGLAGLIIYTTIVLLAGLFTGEERNAVLQLLSKGNKHAIPG